jgi:hypothetical protein
VGKPSEYTEEMAVEVAHRISEGGSLHKIELDPAMPSARTILRWCREHPDFDRLLAHARCVKADKLFDESVEISDEPVLDAAQAARQRTRVQARQYAAARLNPARYAERLAVGQAPELPPIETMGKFAIARRIAFALHEGRLAVLEHEDVEDAG